MASVSENRRRRMQLVFPADPVADDILKYIDSFPGGRSAHRSFAVLDLIRRGWASLQHVDTATGVTPVRPAVALAHPSPSSSGPSLEDRQPIPSEDRQTKVANDDSNRDNARQGVAMDVLQLSSPAVPAGSAVKNVLRGLINGGPQANE
jgi:hypothetical protein